MCERRVLSTSRAQKVQPYLCSGPEVNRSKGRSIGIIDSSVLR